MLKKIVLLSSLLITSMTAHAGLIQFGDYKRDSTSNIVSDGKLEWLKWDVTKGMSINDALAKYSQDGWRLASNVNMASLFTSFNFGKAVEWSTAETVFQSERRAWLQEDEQNEYAQFVMLFGNTYHETCVQPLCNSYYYLDNDPYVLARAFFGDDQNSNSRYQQAFVEDDNTKISLHYGTMRGGHQAQLSADWHTTSSKDAFTGVALVRNFVPAPAAVPTPGPIGLLILGLLALGYRRRQVLGR